MNLIAIFSACGLGMLGMLGVFLWANRRRMKLRHRDVNRVIVPLYMVMVYVFLSNTLEWLGITTMLDPFEDYAEMLWPLLWGVALYVWIQQYWNKRST